MFRLFGLVVAVGDGNPPAAADGFLARLLSLPAARAEFIMSARWSSFNLLFSDGVVRILFQGLLTPDQYAELREAVEAATSRDQLANTARQLAGQWQIKLIVEFDPL